MDTNTNDLLYEVYRQCRLSVKYANQRIVQASAIQREIDFARGVRSTAGDIVAMLRTNHPELETRFVAEFPQMNTPNAAQKGDE